MMYRVFIAIDLPEKIKKELGQWQEKHRQLPARWTKEASLHLTLVFIGYVADSQLAEICRAMREVTQKFWPFEINFNQIILGPPSSTKTTAGKPRMIWLIGEANEQLSQLKTALETVLLNCDSGLSRVEHRPFRPHLTLARILPIEWARLPNQPAIDEKFMAKVSVSGIKLMESNLKRGGAEYITLDSALFDSD